MNGAHSYATPRSLASDARAESLKVDVINLNLDFSLDDDTTEVILIINGVQVARMSAYRARRVFVSN